jgi:hypothetical protein
MRVTLKVVGRARLTVDLPDSSYELLGSMRARLPAEFNDILFDLGIHSLSEEDFLDQLHTLEVESFKVEPDEVVTPPADGNLAPKGGSSDV